LQRPHLSLARDLLVAMRPGHWVKSAFVLAPAAFAGKLFDPRFAAQALEAALAFALASSAAYLLNDLRDRQQDRENPRTRHRPIAAGRLPLAAVLLACANCAGLAWLAAFQAGVTRWVAAYLAGSLGYTLALKGLPLADLASLVGLYLLRLGAGAAAVQVPASPWLLLCGGSLAWVLAWGKRAEGQGPYPVPLVRALLPPFAACCLAVYLAYTLSQSGQLALGSWAPVTAVPVGVALWRYVRQARAGKGDPITLLRTDPLLALGAATWVLVVLGLLASRHVPV
jgi:hypothetical protein